MSSEISTCQRGRSSGRTAGDITGRWYNDKFYECHPTESGTYIYQGEEYKYYWSNIAGMQLMVRKDIGEEAIAAEAKEAEGATIQDGARDIYQYATLGWARLADLSRLDEAWLAILDDGIRNMRNSIIGCHPPDSEWVKWHIHPQLLALFHRLDIRYDGGRNEMDEDSGWWRYDDISLSADARIRGILGSRRALCNNNGHWPVVAALDTLVEISSWRNIS